MTRRARTLALQVFLYACAVNVCGQGSPNRPTAEARPKFGTAGTSYKQISAVSFAPGSSGCAYWMRGSPAIIEMSPGSACFFNASIDVPEGALLSTIRLDACDDSGGPAAVEMGLWATGALGSPEVATNLVWTTGGGCESVTEDVTYAGIVVSHMTGHYFLSVLVNPAATSNLVGFAGAVIGYQLQVSPPPPSADFGDVPITSPQFQFIEALYNAGITAGCGGGNFCPDNPVTRGQMAVFLAKALGLQ